MCMEFTGDIEVKTAAFFINVISQVTKVYFKVFRYSFLEITPNFFNWLL